MKSSAFLCAFCISVLVSHASFAAKPLAQSLSPDAKVEYDAGKTFFADQDYASALLKFESAYEKSGDVRLLWNAAAAAKGQRRYAKVLELLRLYLKEGDAVLTAADKADAEDLIKTVEPLVSRVRIVVNLADADVSVDGVDVGKSPLSKAPLVEIGTRKLLVKKSGYKPFEQSVVLRERESTVDVVLVPEITVGRLELSATPAAAMVSVDGAPASQATYVGKLQAGVHSVRVTLADYIDYRADVVIKEGENRTLQVSLEKKKGGVPAWAWIAGGVVLAGGAATAVYFVTKPAADRPLPPPGTFNPGYAFASRQF